MSGSNARWDKRLQRAGRATFLRQGARALAGRASRRWNGHCNRRIGVAPVVGHLEGIGLQTIAGHEEVDALETITGHRSLR